MYVCSGNSVNWLKIVALVGVGLWFTFRTKFVQVRY